MHITSPLFTGRFPGNVLRRAVNFVSPQDTIAVNEILRNLRDGGFAAIKVIQDDGLLWTSAATVVPRLSDEVFRALLTNAHKLGIRVYVHVTQRVDAERAVAARADVFIHGVMDTTLPDSLWNRMREQSLVWAPALRIVAAGADRGAYAKRILANPVLTSSLSQQELDALTADAAGTISASDEPFPGLLPNGSRYMRILQEKPRGRHARTVCPLR